MTFPKYLILFGITFLLIGLLTSVSSQQDGEEDKQSADVEEDEIVEDDRQPDDKIADDDDDEGDEGVDEVKVETDEGAAADDSLGDGTSVTDTKEEAEEEKVQPIQSSPDADTTVYFVIPAGSGSAMPAGKPVELLVGFTNRGSNDFTIDYLDASFRYPQDFTYLIQNFSRAEIKQTIGVGSQGTFNYGFTPADTLHGRPFGFVLVLSYHDSEDKQFQTSVFNDTVNVTEPDEGFDGETFFLYVILLAVTVLVIVGIHQLLTTYGKGWTPGKSGRSGGALGVLSAGGGLERGTQSPNKEGIDMDYIDDHHLKRTTPKNSPNARVSPRRRKQQQQRAD